MGVDSSVQASLVERIARDGVYLVGWYSSANWDPSDARRAAAGRRDRAVVEQVLSEKAEGLAREGAAIALRFMNLRM